MKLNCVIDTCSCVYLSRVEFRQKTLLRHLFDSVTLCVSKEVSLEITDHKDKGLPKFIQNRALVTQPQKHTMNDYETRMMGKVLPSRKKKGDKGEIDNFIVAIDQIHHMKKGMMVYITDDQNAINGNLDRWIDAFPAIRYWTSYDVVLFLYAEKIIPSKDIALEMVKDIIATTAPELSERSEKTAAKITKTLSDYNRKIDNISRIFN